MDFLDFLKSQKKYSGDFLREGFSGHLVWMTTSVFSDMDSPETGYSRAHSGLILGHRLVWDLFKTDISEISGVQLEKRSKSLEI